MRFLPGVFFVYASLSLLAAQESAAEESHAAAPSAAHNDVHENEEKHKNLISLRAVYSYHLLDERSDAPEAPHGESLYGFSLAYGRVLIEEWLTLDISKPIMWGSGRFDSPLDVLLMMPFQWGQRWELSVGVGATYNIRIFDQEREKIEGQANELSLGILAGATTAYRVTPQWQLELGFDYAYIPGNVIVTSEFSPAFGIAHLF